MMNKRIKPILPSLKEKKRYLVFKLYPDIETDSYEIENKIKESFRLSFGSVDLGKAGIQLVDYRDNIGILRISNKSLEKGRYALSMINEINSCPVILQTIGVSGILKKAKSKYFAS